MSRHIITIRTVADRAKALLGVQRAPWGWTLELREAKRTDAQNAALWSLLNQIQRQRPEHRGVEMTPDLWKAVFMDALGSETTVMPKLDQPGYFAMHSTSRLTKTEFADLITLILAWAAKEDLTIEHFDGDQSSPSPETKAA